MSERKIQQQMYTRERMGIFQSTDGYDTIAISAGLDKSFVKKYLHPICAYHTPNVLKKQGEKDASKYPAATTLIQPETGDLVTGQAVFVPADFTGQRSTFFMHNYMIPADLKESWIKHPSKLFSINQYSHAFDIGSGNELPELSVVSYRENNISQLKGELFECLGLDEVLFKQLLYAVMSSVASKKKVYITLNVALDEYNRYALMLLELLFIYLPYEARRKLGYLTFSNEPESKKYIHVMFVENGSLHPRDRALDKHFVFDLANSKRVAGLDLEGQEHEYLDFAWNHLKNSLAIDDFFEFAEQALKGHDSQVKSDLATYYQLCVIYQVNKGQTAFYEKNKIGILQGILKFIEINPAEKKELVRLFMKLVQREGKITDATLAVDYLNCILKFGTSQFLTEFIVNTLQHYQGQPLSPKLWETLMGNKVVFANVAHHLLKTNEGLLTDFLIDRFGKLNQVKTILKEISQLLEIAPVLLSCREFYPISGNQLSKAVFKDHPFEAVLAIHQFFAKLNIDEIHFLDFKEKILNHVDQTLLKNVQLNKVSLKEIELFGNIFAKIKNFPKGDVYDQYTILLALYELFFEPMQNAAYYYQQLPERCIVEFRQIVKRLISENLTTQQLDKAMVAFTDGYATIDFPNGFQFISQYGNDAVMLAFIKNSIKQHLRDANFTSALKNYLISPDSIWKNKLLRKELKQIKSKTMQRIIKDVQYKKASPISKFFRKNKMMVMLVISTFLLAAIVSVFAFQFLTKDKQPVATHKQRVEKIEKKKAPLDNQSTTKKDERTKETDSSAN